MTTRRLLARLLVAAALVVPGCSGEPKVAKFEPKAGTNALDLDRVSAYVDTYEGQDDGALGRAMDEPDFDKRAAAARVILRRNGITPTEDGIRQIRSEWLSSDQSDRVNFGFWLLGCLAAQGVAPEEIQQMVLDWLEIHPQDPVADQALWALGETGRAEALGEFYRIATATEKYGPKARERSFCCVAQCGRYSGTTRFEAIPKILEIAEAKKGDAQTEGWCLQALHDMAPGVAAASIADWKDWWAAQKKLRGA